MIVERSSKYDHLRWSLDYDKRSDISWQLIQSFEYESYCMMIVLAIFRVRRSYNDIQSTILIVTNFEVPWSYYDYWTATIVRRSWGTSFRYDLLIRTSEAHLIPWSNPKDVEILSFHSLRSFCTFIYDRIRQFFYERLSLSVRQSQMIVPD